MSFGPCKRPRWFYPHSSSCANPANREGRMVEKQKHSRCGTIYLSQPTGRGVGWQPLLFSIVHSTTRIFSPTFPRSLHTFLLYFVVDLSYCTLLYLAVHSL